MLKSVALLAVIVGISGNVHASQTIGNWDCVPYQVLNAPFKLGVVAFHETGVDVEIFADGASLGTVSDPTYNDRTDCYEYWVEIDPAVYSDGVINMTAVISPDGSGHESRTLDTLVLYANNGGTVITNDIKWVDYENGDDGNDGSEGTPYKNIEKGLVEVGNGGTVYLKASQNYILTNLHGSNDHANWTTVRCAPGLTKDDVHILGQDSSGISAHRFGENRVRWSNVSLYKTRVGYSAIFYFENTHNIWLDSVTIYDALGQWNGGGVFSGNSGYKVYLTNSVVRDIMTGDGGLRNNINQDIGSDIYRPRDNFLSINMTCTGIDVGPTAAHPDFWQCYCVDDTITNCILYNCRNYNMGAQGIFGCNSGCYLKDIAFVNIMLEKDPKDSYLSSQPGNMEHVLIYHFTTVDQSWGMGSPESCIDWTVKNCNWSNFNGGAIDTLPGQDISHNHVNGLSWNQPAALGTDATIGDQGFVDYDSDDYRVTDSSACYQSGTPLPGVPADIDNVLYNLYTPNRGCFAAGNASGIRHPQRAMHTGIGPVWLNNPFSDRLSVGLEDEGTAVLSLVTPAGVPVECRQIGNTLVTAGVPAGIYFVSIRQGNRTAVLRVVKTQ